MFGFNGQNGFVHLGGPICQGGFCGGNTLTRGSIRVKKNTNTIFGIGSEIVGDTVGGNLQVLRNQGPQTKLVQNNTVAGKLQCFDNEPPFVGGPQHRQQCRGSVLLNESQPRSLAWLSALRARAPRPPVPLPPLPLPAPFVV
jgi:hypothetical protein